MYQFFFFFFFAKKSPRCQLLEGLLQILVFSRSGLILYGVFCAMITKVTTGGAVPDLVSRDIDPCFSWLLFKKPLQPLPTWGDSSSVLKMESYEQDGWHVHLKSYQIYRYSMCSDVCILSHFQGRAMQSPAMMGGIGRQGMGMGIGGYPAQMAANPYAAFGAAAHGFNAGMGAPSMQLQRGLRGLDPGMNYNPFSVSIKV